MKNKLLKISIVVTGLLSLAWFLFRVIPKPSRAFYPCQRAAFPIATSFIIWLIGVFSSLALFRSAKLHLSQQRFVFSATLFFSSVVLFFAISTTFQPKSTQAEAKGIEEVFIPVDQPNTPMGDAKGIFPGRVVWTYNPDATSWTGKTGFWWEDKNTSMVEVEKMLSQTIRQLTGATAESAAWDKLFRYFNTNQGKGEVGYTSGEKIAIKINMNNQKDHKNFTTNQQNSSPQMMLALLRQLVNKAGVKPTDITFYDASRYVSATVYSVCKTEFPEVNFVDIAGGDGRIQYVKDEKVQIKWSQALTLESSGGNPTYLPTCVTQASYLINLASLKGHNLAGISLCGKNHFGSIISVNPANTGKSFPQAAGVHPYATVHDFAYWNFPARAMGTYNTIVDLMGFKHLGQKTLLFLVDGLYAAPTQMNPISENDKWLSPPFNNDWTSSLFASLDQVALESVCLDFLRTEQKYSKYMTEVYGNVDNYLHEAALANQAPSKIVYDPEQDGIPLQSLGVHEHWNNETDKQYSRNLKTGTGIELIKLSSSTATGVSELNAKTEKTTLYPNPIKRGEPLQILNIDNKINGFELINMKNQVVFKTEFTHQSVVIPQTVSEGIYVAVIKTAKSKIAVKLIVE